MTELEERLVKINQANKKMVTAFGILSIAMINMTRAIKKLNEAYQKGVIEGDVIDGTATVIEE